MINTVPIYLVSRTSVKMDDSLISVLNFAIVDTFQQHEIDFSLRWHILLAFCEYNLHSI